MPDTPDPATNVPETVLAFDFGLRRIGVAVGQSVTGSASPLGIVANGVPGPDFNSIAALVAEWRPTRLVVGLPFHADGTDSEMLRQVRDFVGELGRFGLPVATVDERYSSVEAERLLKDARASGNRGRIRKSDIDTAAAVCIAERYLSAT
jgi:putative Holliday junction resolvase